LISSNRVFLADLFVAKLVKKFPANYETQELIAVFTVAYPESGESNPHPHALCL